MKRKIRRRRSKKKGSRDLDSLLPRKSSTPERPPSSFRQSGLRSNRQGSPLGSNLQQSNLLQLQKLYGNRFVQRMLDRDRFGAESSSVRSHGGERRPDYFIARGGKSVISEKTLSPAGKVSIHRAARSKSPKSKKGRDKSEKWTAVISELKKIRNRTHGRVGAASKYLDKALPAADAVKAKLDKAADNFEQAYTDYSTIIDIAKESATSKEALVDSAIGIAVGVPAGLLAGAALPRSAGIGLKFLAEFLSTSGDTGLAAAASSLTGISPGSFELPIMLHPMAARVKHYKHLVALYRGLSITGKDALGKAIFLSSLERLIGQATLLEAGVPADMTADELLKSLVKVRSLEKALTIHYPIDAVLDLSAKIAAKPVPSKIELEQLIWVYWIMNLGDIEEEAEMPYFHGDTSALDEDVIEDYLHGSIKVLGPGSLLGVDFGDEWWTAREDEREAVLAAHDKWGELMKEHGDIL